MAIKLSAALANIAWQSSNIFDGIRRIPAFFRRINPESTGSPGAMLRRFVLATAPDIHGEYEVLTRINTFLELIKDDDISWGDARRMVQAFVVQGDITIEGTKVQVQALYNQFANIAGSYAVDVLPGIGNHDTNSRYSNDSGTVMSKAEQKTALIDPLVASVDSVVLDELNSNACYYYKDYDGGDAFKVRVIMLDMYDSPQGVTGTTYNHTQFNCINYSQSQLLWLATVALATPSADWHVIVFGHENLATEGSGNDSHLVVQQLLDAFTQQGSVDLSDTTTDYEYDIDVDFSSQNGFNGSLIGYFYGHGHIPIIDKITINTREYNCCEMPAADQGRIGYSSQSLTGVQDMMSFIIVDTEDRRIFILRYGCPFDINGAGTPFGDYGISVVIEY